MPHPTMFSYLSADVLEVHNLIGLGSGDAPMGTWLSEPFDPAHFTGLDGMIWTVTSDAIWINRYTRVGKTLIWRLWIHPAATGGAGTSDLSGTPAPRVRLKLPAGAVAPINIGDGTDAAAADICRVLNTANIAQQLGDMRIDPLDGTWMIIQTAPSIVLDLGYLALSFTINLEIL